MRERHEDLLVLAAQLLVRNIECILNRPEVWNSHYQQPSFTCCVSIFLGAKFNSLLQSTWENGILSCMIKSVLNKNEEASVRDFFFPLSFATRNVQGDYSCGCGCGLRITTWFPGTATDLLSVHLICPCFGSQLTSQKDSFFNATTMKMLSLMFVRGLESLVNRAMQSPWDAEII